MAPVKTAEASEPVSGLTEQGGVAVAVGGLGRRDGGLLGVRRDWGWNDRVGIGGGKVEGLPR